MRAGSEPYDQTDDQAGSQASQGEPARSARSAGSADRNEPLQAVAGILASSVTGELARPLRELREILAIMVEALDRHLREAEGPTPYPWKSLQLLRQELSNAYLLSRETARMASDLYETLEASDDEIVPLDANRHIEAAIALVRHRVSGHTELFVDLGSLPPVHAAAGEFTLAVAKMLLACVESASACEGSAISVKSRVDPGDGVGSVVIYVADNGIGVPAAAASVIRALTPIMLRLGGQFDGVSEPGQGSAYECRLPLRQSST